jgi:hypothetical protein
MKLVFFLLLSVFLSGSILAEEIKVPAGVYRIAKLEEAMDLAGKQKKPLVIVCGSSSPGDKEQAESLVDTLKAGSGWAVPVLVVNKEFYSLPPPVITAAQAEVALPTILITSPEGDKVWKVIAQESVKPRAEMKEHVGAGIKACKAEISAWFSARPLPGPVLPGDTELDWKVAGEDKLVCGVFGQVRNEGLYFRGRDVSQPADIPLAKLSPAALRYVRYITRAGAPSRNAPKTGAALEKWTSSQGRALEAAFISLKDDMVTLRTAAGKEHTLTLETLSTESQKRARELAGAAAKKE